MSLKPPQSLFSVSWVSLKHELSQENLGFYVFWYFPSASLKTRVVEKRKKKKEKMVAEKGKKSKVVERTEGEDSVHIDSQLVQYIEKLQEVQDELEKVLFFQQLLCMCMCLCHCCGHDDHHC